MSKFLLLLLLLATILTLTECQVFQCFVIDETGSMLILFSLLKFSVLDDFLRLGSCSCLLTVDCYRSGIRNLICR